MGFEALALKDFRREHGLLWPDYDERCAAVTFREMSSLPKVLAHVRGRAVVVQAGGNCGQMARELAPLFGAVYTFEPDPRNFVCLTVNTAEFPNVHRYQAALGKDRALIGLEQGDRKFPANCGAWYAAGRGSIPTLTIDDLGLEVCDLMCLDIEGAEAAAIEGALATIRKSKPAIVIESKGLGSRHYGEAAGKAEWILKDTGYRVAEKLANDLVLVPA